MASKPNRFRDSDEFLTQGLQFLECNQPRIGTAQFDARGDATAMSMHQCHGASILTWIRRGDAVAYRQLALRSAEHQVSLMERAGRGDPISESRVGFMSYQRLFDALASGSALTSTQLAQQIQGRVSQRPDRVAGFDRAMCLTLCAFVEKATRREESLRVLTEAMASDSLKRFAGYGRAFHALLASDGQLLTDALRAIVADHEHLGRLGVWRETVDRELCVWGIGLAHLAHEYGLDTELDCPLLPRALTRA